MKVIVVSKHHGKTRSFTVRGLSKAVFICLLGLPIGFGAWLGHELTAGDGADLFNKESTRTWNQTLQDQRQQLVTAKRNAEERLAALTLRMAELQARLLRIDALGERITTIANLDKGEFDFSQAPAVGGPEEASYAPAYQAPDFIEAINLLSEQISDREQQLETLDALLVNRKVQRDVFVAGRPITKGWMSSRYGRRTDPFNGKIAWHKGVDFAGKLGSDVVAVAAGVVTWSGDRSGYGNMVEINHGSGFSTRYAHNSEHLVSMGDVVKKGQVVALMGSSGRSTGPHVHFEVYKNGRSVDPASYIHRTDR